MDKLFSGIDQVLFTINSGKKVIALECVCNLNDPDYFVKLLLIGYTRPYFPVDRSQEQTKMKFGISIFCDILI